jgi:hypothetical protein
MMGAALLTGQRRGAASLATAWISAAALICAPLALGGCARIHTTRNFRAEPVEKPRRIVEPAGVGYTVRGEVDRSDGQAVFRARVDAVERCRIVLAQRARGVRTEVRTPVRNTMTLQWIFGGLLTAAGSGLLTWQALAPDPGEDALYQQSPTGTYVTGGLIAAGGLALLAGSIVQTAQLGRHETDLGVRELRREAGEETCGRGDPEGAVVRLTLDDNSMYRATADAEGRADLLLPADLDARLSAHGPRATLEVKGDARSQRRVKLR